MRRHNYVRIYIQAHHIASRNFFEGGAQILSLPPGASYPRYATVHHKNREAHVAISRHDQFEQHGTHMLTPHSPVQLEPYHTRRVAVK